MPYADKERRNEHYRRAYGIKYWTDEEFRKKEAERKSRWYHADPERREKVRLQVAAWRAKNKKAMAKKAKAAALKKKTAKR